ncbi:MAG: SIR2 family NAD-dependent protein deacylase [Terrimicrobiaceae bacterium]
MSLPAAKAFDFAAKLLSQAESVVVFTGAGMSKESGIPTFRDAMEGLWENFSPEDLATPEAFESEPQRVRDFYEYRRGFVRKAKPNAGHLAIAEMEELFPEVIVVTQNVDCLHEAAGSTSVINLHGEILSNRCNRGCPGTRPGSRTVCPTCGGDSLRPNVVWFGEPLDPILMSRARISVNCASVLLVIGTSGVVYPAAGLVDIAVEKGIPFIEINPSKSPFSARAASFLPLSAAVALPGIVARLRGKPEK